MPGQLVCPIQNIATAAMSTKPSSSRALLTLPNTLRRYGLVVGRTFNASLGREILNEALGSVEDVIMGVRPSPMTESSNSPSTNTNFLPTDSNEHPPGLFSEHRRICTSNQIAEKNEPTFRRAALGKVLNWILR